MSLPSLTRAQPAIPIGMLMIKATRRKPSCESHVDDANQKSTHQECALIAYLLLMTKAAMRMTTSTTLPETETRRTVGLAPSPMIREGTRNNNYTGNLQKHPQSRGPIFKLLKPLGMLLHSSALGKVIKQKHFPR